MTDICDAETGGACAPARDAVLSPTRSWLAVCSVAVGTFALVTTEFLPIGLLSRIADDLGVSDGTAGLMVTSPAIVAAIAAPVLMIAAGRLDRRVLLAVLSTMLLASNLLSAFAPNFPLMLASRLLLGISVGGFWSIAASVGLRLVTPENAARATSLILAGISVGTVLGVPAGSLIGELAGWRAAFLANGALSAVVLLAQVSLLPALPTRHAIVADDLLKPFRDPVGRLGLIAMVLIGVGHFSAYTYMEPFLRQVPQLEAGIIAAALGGYGLAGLLGNFAGGILAGRRIRIAMLVVAAGLGGSMLLLALFGTSPGAAITFVILWGIAFGAMPVTIQTWTMKASADAPEGGLAVMVSVLQVALASGAFFGGLVVDHLGVSGVMVLGGALMAAVVLTLMVDRRSPNDDVVLADGAAAH
jgi:predicted MFS family arabinose efflux permease